MNMHRVHGFLLGFLTLISCDAQKRDFTNVNDPHPTGTSQTSTIAGAGTSGGTSVDGPGAPSAGASSGTTSAGGSTVPGAAYNFANSITTTPTGCSAVQKVQVFDNGDGLGIFIEADCGQGNQLYGYKAGYSGAATSSPVQISTACIAVSSSSVDRGRLGYLAVYTCSLDAKAAAVTTAMQVTSTTTFETSTVVAYSYRVSWNEVAGAFGVFRSGKFQRLSESASAIGGPVTIIDFTGPFLPTVDSSGNWRAAPDTNSLISLTSTGVLGCKSTSQYSSGVFVSPSIVLELWIGNLYVLQVDPNTCVGTGTGISVSTGAVAGAPYATTLLAATPLNATIIGLLYEDSSSLKLAAVMQTGKYALLGESSVTGFTTSLRSAYLKVIKGKVYVAYAKEGAGFIVFSNESVP